MDAGASVAGFIGLVGLVAQSTTNLIQLIKDIKDTPGTYQSNLKWLEQISCILNDLQNLGSILQKAKLTVDLTTMEEYLRDCCEAIDILRAHLEKSLNGMKSTGGVKSTGLEKRKATLKAYFGSRSADCQIQNIQRAIEGLSLCHNSIVGQIGVQSHRSIQDLTVQINDLTLQTQTIRRAGESIATDIASLRPPIERMTTINRQDIQQLQHANLGTLQGVQNLQAGLEWMAAVQAVLPLEIHNLVRNAIAEELRSASYDQQMLSNEAPRKQALSFNPSIQNVSPLERPGTLPASRRLDEISDRQSWEQFEEMEKDCLLPYRNDNYTTSPSNIQGQRTYSKSKILMFSWYYRAFFGYISVVVSERHQVTAGREENIIHVEVKIFPWQSISSRGFQARIWYDRTHGLSFPTNIQLDFPRMIPSKSADEIYWLFSDRESDLIIDNIKSGVYRPNDLLEIPGDFTGPKSLLALASIFADAKVVRFLLQQGARVDQPRGSNLHHALSPRPPWYPQKEGRSYTGGRINSIAKEDRLDTTRLLINAGSDIDCISFSALWTWAIGWGLETILSIVGNNDNFHWDFIQLVLYSWDSEPELGYFVGTFGDQSVPQSNFGTFLELCKRLRIDLSFTQPNGLTLLHWIIEEVEHISHMKHYLSVLVSNGVDPCVVCEGYLTPTLLAFFKNKLDPWFAVLRQLGISVEAVAAHALGIITGTTVQDLLLKIKAETENLTWLFFHDYTLDWLVGQNKEWSTFEAIKQLRAALIEAFERQGYYLNKSGDRGNMVTYKASSSVDFKPSTVYDPERAKRDVRRRTEAQKNPQ